MLVIGCTLEIKCPFTVKHGDLCEVSCVIAVSGQHRLDHSNRYFCQVQMQKFLTGRRYCDFVIWRPWLYLSCGMGEDIWQNRADGAQGFHAKCVMPELCYIFLKEMCACE